MGRRIKIINQTLLGFGFAAAGIFSAAAGFAACSETSVDLRGYWGQARFSIEVADDYDERAVGLMNREKMSMSAGMLFVYDEPQHVSFWMRNTLIPLDMIFVDQTGVITRIHSKAIPLDETPIDGGLDVLMVLEINGGLAKSMGIDVGSQLRHPKFVPETAIWPCDDR
ncbi:MAG: DUF192 domain-containing protein [Paracoccaceae bacterium]